MRVLVSNKSIGFSLPYNYFDVFSGCPIFYSNWGRKAILKTLAFFYFAIDYYVPLDIPESFNSSKSKKVRFYFPPLWRLNTIATNKRARKLWFSHRVRSRARFGKRRRVLLALLWVLTMDTSEVTLVRFNRGKKVICVLLMKKGSHQTLKQRWRNQIRHWRQTRGLHPGDFQLTSLMWRIQ